jgi:hypothetical protein
MKQRKAIMLPHPYRVLQTKIFAKSEESHFIFIYLASIQLSLCDVGDTEVCFTFKV